MGLAASFADSLTMGATGNIGPTKAMLISCLEEISKSPFAQKPPGPEIVQLLNAAIANDRVHFVATDSRGFEDGKDIYISSNFYHDDMARLLQIECVMVHEAAHLLHKANNHRKDRRATEDQVVDDEYQSWIAELDFYEWKKTRPGFLEDFELETRLTCRYLPKASSGEPALRRHIRREKLYESDPKARFNFADAEPKYPEVDEIDPCKKQLAPRSQEP